MHGTIPVAWANLHNKTNNKGADDAAVLPINGIKASAKEAKEAAQLEKDRKLAETVVTSTTLCQDDRDAHC